MNKKPLIWNDMASPLELTEAEREFLNITQFEDDDSLYCRIPWSHPSISSGYVHKDGTRVILNDPYIVLIKDSKYISLSIDTINPDKPNRKDLLKVKIGDLHDNNPQKTHLPLPNRCDELTKDMIEPLNNNNLSFLVTTVQKYVPEDIKTMKSLIKDLEALLQQKEKNNTANAFRAAFNKWNSGNGIN